MEKHKLSVQKRTIAGRKVKNLRKQGLLPANIYGKNIKSEMVQIDLKEFKKVYNKAGETGIVELKVEGEEKTRPVLIHNPQLHPVDDFPLHVDFYQVSLKEKIKATVPIVISGQASAVINKEGLLLTVLNEVMVECLPTDLPEKIEVDVSQLKKVNEEIKVGKLNIDETKVKILTDTNLVICKISSLITEEAKKEMEAEAATKATAEAEKAAAAAAAGAPGVPPTGAPTAGAPPTPGAPSKPGAPPTSAAPKPEVKKTEGGKK